MENKYVIGVDYGSDSARALVINAANGATVGQAVCQYPRWNQGLYQNAAAGMFRQHPLDYLESLTSCVTQALEQAGEEVRGQVVALAVDTTGSTPCPVNQAGVPLALLPGFEENPNAMFHLWKDHTAVSEAEQITKTFSSWNGIDYTRYQGPYASEWFWAKILHTVSVDPKVRKAAYSWVEHCDWLPALLAGETRPEKMYRSACAAGHKAYWNSAWDGLPDRRCLESLDPYLGQIWSTYGAGPRPCSENLGCITHEWAKRLGLPETTIIAGSAFDAHAGAVGAGICPGKLVLNIGTSAVDMLVLRPDQIPAGNFSYACGAAEDSILPGFIGVETSQAAYGDAYAWLKKLLLFPLTEIEYSADIISPQQMSALSQAAEESILRELEEKARKLPLKGAVTALDWFNGRRYPQVNEHARSALNGLHLGIGAAELYQALVLATAFGQQTLLRTLAREEIAVESIIAVGGIAQKSDYVMQTLSDVLGCRIDVSQTVQACARGAAIYAATAAGLYSDIMAAQQVLCEGVLRSYTPNREKAADYKHLYEAYLDLARWTDLGMICNP